MSCAGNEAFPPSRAPSVSDWIGGRKVAVSEEHAQVAEEKAGPRPVELDYEAGFGWQSLVCSRTGLVMRKPAGRSSRLYRSGRRIGWKTGW